MDPKYFKSKNPQVLMKAVQQVVNSDRGCVAKRQMQTGVDYYNYKHEILNYRLFWVDNEGVVHEETNRSNIKIVHPYFTELTDQQVQYLLSNPVEFKSETEGLETYLQEYIDEDFQLMLQEALEGAVCKGYEFVYVKKTDKRVEFNVADSLKCVEIYDNELNRIAIVRYYDVDVYKDGRTIRVTKAELWNDQETWYFMVNPETRNYELDSHEEINPRPHQILKDDAGKLYGKGYGFIPFLRLDNNKAKISGLAPVKALIDDYDLMACALSNNLQDFDQPFIAVRGYNCDDLKGLLNNLKARGTVGTGEDGGLDIHTVDIPVEARKAKLNVDREAIYKFGMGFDSSQVGDGNITNVVIQSRYSLLDLKCNKAEVRLRKLIKSMLKIIIDDINERNSKNYSVNDVEIVITRDTTVNEKELVEQEKLKADTQQVLISNLVLAANRIDDETVLKRMCDILEIDYEEVNKSLATQDYVSEFDKDSEPDE